MCSTVSVTCVFSTDAYLVKEASIPSFERVLPIKQDTPGNTDPNFFHFIEN